ncbi:hypothetical protein ASE00_21030 [Sphingomonas sp. Root710]|uniref:LysR family transcriptional regulator n=1 Tax=Sphingomonas sp. Root710 TaxID=1736594 RepID=UPI0007016C68|nr:LysR family transcriptional regulator [Sphingomonas sp. Root710]KRB78863.1 hypothetical protein ASE00_21030 [Sphingomonas sp. Root710]
MNKRYDDPAEIEARAAQHSSPEQAANGSMRRLRSSQVTLQKLQIFCAVIDQSGVTRAAEKLGVAQPAVTAQLRSLEDKLGVTLLRKSGRILVLTEAGDRVYRWASEMIARSFEIERELGSLSDGAAGSAVIAATMAAGSYLVTDMVVEFSRANPGAHIAVQVSSPPIALDAVRNGSCDFAIVVLDRTQDIADLTAQKLWEEPLVLCASPEGAPISDSLSNAQLSDVTWVTPPRGLVTRDLEDQMLRANGVVMRNIALELGHPEALKRAARAGIGVTFLPETTIRDDLALKMLRRIETPDLQHVTLPVFLVHRRRKLLSALQRRLLDHIVNSRPKEYVKRDEQADDA